MNRINRGPTWYRPIKPNPPSRITRKERQEMESLPTDTFASSRTYEKSGIPALRWLKNIFSRLIGQGVSQSGFLAPAIAEVCLAEQNRLRNRPVEFVGGRNDNARVAVIDSFSSSSDFRLHGDHVLGVLQREGDLRPSELQRVNFDAGSAVELLLEPGPESPSERLDAYIKLDALIGVEDKNKILRRLKTNENLQVINMSLGIEPLGTVESIFGKALNRKEASKERSRFLFDAVGLPHSYEHQNLKLLRQRLLNRVSKVLSDDPSFQKSCADFRELSSELKSNGVSFVVAAGNNETQAETLRGLGYHLPGGSTMSYFHNPHAIVVGALDDKGTADPSDDELAPFSTRSLYTSVLANGTKVPVDPFGGGDRLNGTSFAAPIVAGRIARMKTENPGARPEEMVYLIADQIGVRGSGLPAVNSPGLDPSPLSFRPVHQPRSPE